MPYIHITRTPGVTLKDYQVVHEALGAEPIEGLLLHIVGEVDGVMHMVDVWESSAVGDRFAAERLFPAFESTGIRPGADATAQGFDGEILIDARA